MPNTFNFTAGLENAPNYEKYKHLVTYGLIWGGSKNHYKVKACKVVVIPRFEHHKCRMYLGEKSTETEQKRKGKGADEEIEYDEDVNRKLCNKDCRDRAAMELHIEHEHRFKVIRKEFKGGRYSVGQKEWDEAESHFEKVVTTSNEHRPKTPPAPEAKRKAPTGPKHATKKRKANDGSVAADGGDSSSEDEDLPTLPLKKDGFPDLAKISKAAKDAFRQVPCKECKKLKSGMKSCPLVATCHNMKFFKNRNAFQPPPGLEEATAKARAKGETAAASLGSKKTGRTGETPKTARKTIPAPPKASQQQKESLLNTGVDEEELAGDDWRMALDEPSRIGLASAKLNEEETKVIREVLKAQFANETITAEQRKVLNKVIAKRPKRKPNTASQTGGSRRSTRNKGGA